MEDDDITGFGQITALLLCLAPVWSLWQAYTNYVEHLKKDKARGHQDHQTSLLEPIVTDSPQTASAVTVPLVYDPRRFSDTYEMQVVAPSSVPDSSTSGSGNTALHTRNVANAQASDGGHESAF